MNWLNVFGIAVALAMDAFAVSIAFAGRALRRWGRVAEILGAGILILIGIRVLISHGRGAL